MSALLDRLEAESILRDLAAVFARGLPSSPEEVPGDPPRPNLEAKYRTLVEQLPAVVFMAYLDRAIGEAYVSPKIEELMGFTQAEWLEDPVRWYNHIHPEDQRRWSVEAADMFLTGKPLRSAYRVLSRDGRVVWFQCEVKMVRRADGRPWFIHGVGFDITELKQIEAALERERNLFSAVLDTVGALVAVLTPSGQIVRLNRMCQQVGGYTTAGVSGRFIWELFPVADEARGFRALLAGLRPGQQRDYECDWAAGDGSRRRIAWSTTILPAAGTAPAYVISSGTDITERKRMEKALLEISGREQRQIGQDLHDGLGQHLTGIAFMSKVLAQQLADDGVPTGTARGQDRAAGERRHQPHPAARPRSVAGLLRFRWTDVGAPAIRRGSRRLVHRLLPVRLLRPDPHPRRRHGHPPVSHRAGGRQQRAQARRSRAHRDRPVSGGRHRQPHHLG